MDGRASTAPLGRVVLVGFLSLACWVALRVWTADRHAVPNEMDPEIAEVVAVPPGQPLIDWKLFRFPTLELSSDDVNAKPHLNGESLLSLLKPNQPEPIGDGFSFYTPELELDRMTAPAPSDSLSDAELERMSAVARGVDKWFPDDGLYHPWAILGMNTCRGWTIIGRAWTDFWASPPTGELLVDTGVRVGGFLSKSIRLAPQQLVGPRISVDPDDRLAMATPREPQPTLVNGVDATTFAEPTTLLAQIERLAERPWSAPWAVAVDHDIRRLCSGSVRDATDLASTLDHLELLSRQARELAAECDQEPLRMELMQAHYGLARRLNRWQLTADLHNRPTSLWARHKTQEINMGSILARQRFASRGPIVGFDSGVGANGALDVESGSSVARLVNVAQLSADLEALESTGNARAAQSVVAGQRQLHVSTDERHRQLASEIEEHYRNANFRIAVSAELLNRWLPAQTPVTQPVRDRIVGTPVRGQSRTETELTVRLVPDPFLWRVGLEARGDVAATTTSGERSVAVRSQGSTSFEARKLLLVRADGVQAWPAVAKADAEQRLLGISSSYDQVPLVGSFVRSQANEEYHRRREQARREVETKVAARARAALDEQSEAWIEDIEQQFRDRALRQAEELELDVTPIELRTTDTRVIARLRLANENQLAAYTPRPQAPLDSLLSVQLHDTALNNALQGLKLGGRRLTGVELIEVLANKLGIASGDLPEAARRTTFEFDEDAVHVRLTEGRLHVTIVVREMIHDRVSVRDFKVHAHFRPRIEGISATLVRDGSLEMEGRLRHADRARLHAVFGKALAEDRTFDLVRLPSDADTAQRLAGLMITQLVIDDGWLGLSVGPATAERTAVRTRYLR